MNRGERLRTAVLRTEKRKIESSILPPDHQHKLRPYGLVPVVDNPVVLSLICQGEMHNKHLWMPGLCAVLWSGTRLAVASVAEPYGGAKRGAEPKNSPRPGG